MDDKSLPGELEIQRMANSMVERPFWVSREIRLPFVGTNRSKWAAGVESSDASAATHPTSRAISLMIALGVQPRGCPAMAITVYV